jgi:Ni/Co efflux regulator RcnB
VKRRVEESKVKRREVENKRERWRRGEKNRVGYREVGWVKSN